MGESLMVGRGAGSGPVKLVKRFKTEIIQGNQDYIVPKAINNAFILNNIEAKVFKETV